MASTQHVDVRHLSASSLIAAVPQLFQLASSRTPAVVNVSAGHQSSDAIAQVMAVSQSGLALLCSTTEQEARDLATIATVAAIKTRTPFLHFHDTTGSIEADNTIVRKLVTDEELEALKTQQEQQQQQPAQTAYLRYKSGKPEDALDVFASLKDVFASFASTTGREYSAFSYVGHAEAEHVVVSMGAAADAVEQRIKSNGAKVGVLKIRVYRPFSTTELFSQIPKSVKRIAVLEPQDFTASWNPVFLEVAAAYQVAGDEDVDIVSAQYASFVNEAAVDSVLEHLSKSQVERRFVVGESATKTSSASSANAQEPVETPYIKMLDQVFQDRLEIANAVNSASVWSPDASKPETATPEYGFGKLINKIQERARFIDAVEKAVKDSALTVEAQKSLSQWLLLAKSNKHQPEQVDAAAATAVQALESDEKAKSLLAQKDLLKAKSNWLIGSDSWAYDLGQSGVHHVITSGENVNMLIVDTTPYSSPVEKENRKKDIGLYAMNYGSVYVASVAIYSSYTGVLHALLEADAYNGPSIVIAYLPKAEERSSLETLKETKVSVDNGSWPLYRWNPALEAENKEPFTLDSQRIKKDLEDFLKRENHLTQLVAQNPDIANALVSSLESVSHDIHVKNMTHDHSFVFNRMSRSDMMH